MSIEEQLAEIRDQNRLILEKLSQHDADRGDELLTAEQAAPIVKRSVAALKKAAYRGSIKSVRVGRDYKFRRADLLGSGK